MSHEAAYHGTVLLLYPRLVVLTVRTGACELDASLFIVAKQCLVDEHAVVVRVYAPDRNREDAVSKLSDYVRLSAKGKCHPVTVPNKVGQGKGRES